MTSSLKLSPLHQGQTSEKHSNLFLHVIPSFSMKVYLQEQLLLHPNYHLRLRSIFLSISTTMNVCGLSQGSIASYPYSNKTHELADLRLKLTLMANFLTQLSQQQHQLLSSINSHAVCNNVALKHFIVRLNNTPKWPYRAVVVVITQITPFLWPCLSLLTLYVRGHKEKHCFLPILPIILLTSFPIPPIMLLLVHTPSNKYRNKYTCIPKSKSLSLSD